MVGCFIMLMCGLALLGIIVIVTISELMHDKAYNAKLAELAEKEFGLSQRSFDSWDRGVGRELEEWVDERKDG